MDKQDVEKTAIVTQKELYEYIKLLFGPKKAPATSKKAMGVLLATIKWCYALVYVDGITVFLEAPE